MKYIKGYKIFENNEDKAEYIRDIFLELIDDGFEVDIRKRTEGDPESKYLEVFIKNNDGNKFKISDISEYLYRSIDYMSGFNSVIKYEERKWLSPTIRATNLKDIESKEVYRVWIYFYRPGDNYHVIWINRDDYKIWDILKADFKTADEAREYIQKTHIGGRNDIIKAVISDEQYWLKERH
jgi:hypothetical protein